MKAVRFDVSGDLLAEWLQLPHGVDVIGVNGFDHERHCFEVVVAGPDFPQVQEDELPVKVDPTLTKRAAAWNWNLP